MSDIDTRQPLRVGLTGGIASGKSTVSDLFASQGVQIIDTDVIAHEVVAAGKPAIEEIRKRFGNAIIDEKGNLDRSAMRKLVFMDASARSDLEAILHPRIGDEVKRQAQSIEGPYQIVVVPLLVDSPLLQFVDRVLVVDCDESNQLKRLLRRDAGTIEEAKRILAAQANRQDRLAIADDVITNDSNIRHLENRVIALHGTYLRLATL